MPTEAKLIVGAIGSIIVIALVFIMLPFTIVDAGEKAVITNNGAVARVIGPGLHFRAPIVEHAVKYDIRTQKEQTDAAAASADLQNVNATIALNYNVNPDTVADMYARIGTEDVIKAKVIDPAIQEVVKAATAKYTATDLLTKRAEVTAIIKQGLIERLQPYDLVVTDVSVVNFAFSDSFNAAIEAKVTAEQNAQAAKNKLEQVKYEAEQKVTTATADAEAIKIQAQAINSQGGADYVNLQAVQKWNGVLPTQFVPGSAIPFLGKL